MEAKFTKDHEWIKILDDGSALVGISNHAQEALGDITFVELPQVGSEYKAGESFGVVESVKAASDIYMPVDASILETNSALEGDPQLVNSDPMGAGWLVRVAPSNPADADALMSEADYLKTL